MTDLPRPLVIPIFISHHGCPFRCIFCDQNSINGTSGLPSTAGIVTTINTWLASRSRGRGQVEVAFFGGSFTAIDHGQQARLLGAVAPFLADGRVDSVRISTRPDFLDDDRLEFIRAAGVRTVEVGIQSLRDDTLERCGRGHDAACAVAAVRRLKEWGFIAGVQMMLGLPGETTASILAGIRAISDLRPDIARIYPVLVISGTGLARLWKAGEYRPLNLQRALSLSVRVREIFVSSGVRVIRCGLQPEAGLFAKVLAGPWHPAFGELVYSRMLFRQARSLLKERRGRGRLVVNRRDESALRGQGNHNLKKLFYFGLGDGVEILFSDTISRGCLEFC